MAVFLLIAFGLAWGFNAFVYYVLGWSLINPLVQLPAAFAPAIAALVVRRWVTREGFADAGARPRLRAGWRYYLVAWLGPLGVAAVVVGLAAVTGRPVDFTADVIGGVPLWAAIPVLCVLAVVVTVVFWGEEFGWTGYLLLRIHPGHPRRAAVVAGLIAGVWHWPLAFMGYAEYDNLLLGLTGWTAWIVCQEILLAWLRERSGSVWPACLAHSGNNMVLVPLTSALLVGTDVSAEQPTQWLIVVVLAAAAAGPFLRLGRTSTPDRAHAVP